jgi:tRNA pseudouridine(38-40) synthase
MIQRSLPLSCARTDKGVHAAGNLICLKLIVEDEDIVKKINGLVLRNQRQFDTVIVLEPNPKCCGMAAARKVFVGSRKFKGSSSVWKNESKKVGQRTGRASWREICAQAEPRAFADQAACTATKSFTFHCSVFTQNGALKA